MTQNGIDPLGKGLILNPMMKKQILIALTGLALAFPLSSAMAQKAPDESVRSTLFTADGKTVGTAQFEKAPKGVLITMDVSNLASGWHGLHLHEKAMCGAGMDHSDHFKSAGAHLAAEGQSHGFFSVAGMHDGDLPNLWIAKDGTGHAQFYTEKVSYDKIVKGEGASIMIHAAPDDYFTQPSGASGDRIACGDVKDVPPAKP